MPYYKFGPNDLLYNQLKAHPQTEFIIYNRASYYNKVPQITGSHVVNVGCIGTGNVSLYELNVDRASDNLIYPFITKDSGLTSFNTVSTSQYNQDFNYGDVISSSYPMSSSYHREYYASTTLSRPRLDSIKTAMRSYTPLSPNFRISSSFAEYTTGSLNMFSIPSIFYGSTIKKGTMDLNFYVTGTLVGRAQDIDRNGNLIQTLPEASPGSGSTVGVVLYDEGIVLLNGTTDLSAGKFKAIYDGSQLDGPRWIYFGASKVSSSLYSVSFSGTEYVPTITMFAKAPQGQLNSSNNPTFKSKTLLTSSYTTSSLGFFEVPTPIKNINTSSFANYNEKFENVTYISSIGIYDKEQNLIAVAKVANPIRKLESEDYTFKLKLDI